MAKKLYKFHWDCGRQGDLEGMFIADEQAVADAIGKEAQFGEALGNIVTFTENSKLAM